MMIAPKNFRRIETIEAMTALKDAWPVTSGDVFRFLAGRGSDISRPTVSVMLGRLVEECVVVRMRHPDRGNKWFHRLADSTKSPAMFALQRLLEKYFTDKGTKLAFLQEATGAILNSA